MIFRPELGALVRLFRAASVGHVSVNTGRCLDGLVAFYDAGSLASATPLSCARFIVDFDRKAHPLRPALEVDLVVTWLHSHYSSLDGDVCH